MEEVSVRIWEDTIRPAAVAAESFLLLKEAILIAASYSLLLAPAAPSVSNQGGNNGLVYEVFKLHSMTATSTGMSLQGSGYSTFRDALNSSKGAISYQLIV